MAVDDIVFQTDDTSGEGQSFELELAVQSTGVLLDIATDNKNAEEALVYELRQKTVIADNRRKVR
jgi:hypothetical protein